MRTHYEVLGLTPGSTAKEIREAFLRLAEVHHPDKGGTHDAMAELNRAYIALRDDRKAYGLWLDMTKNRCKKCRGTGKVPDGFKNKKLCPTCNGVGYTERLGDPK